MKFKLIEDHKNLNSNLWDYLVKENISRHEEVLGGFGKPWVYKIECQPEDVIVIKLKFPDVKVRNES